MEQISRSESVASDTKEKYFSPNHDHYFETDWLSLNISPKLDKATI